MRDPIIADRIAGMSYNAIAKRHGVSPFTARYRCKRALEDGVITAQQIMQDEHVSKRRPIVATDLRWVRESARKVMDGCYLEEGQCWPWLHSKSRNGYGQLTFRGKRYAAHRLMFAAANGAVPDTAVVRHKCDTPACCNPDHLEIGTDQDNSQDARKRGKFKGQLKTHCVRGHELSGENLYVAGDGLRNCVACARIRQRMRAGWSLEQAMTMPTTPKGNRPVGGSFHKQSAVHVTTDMQES